MPIIATKNKHEPMKFRIQLNAFLILLPFLQPIFAQDEQIDLSEIWEMPENAKIPKKEDFEKLARALAPGVVRINTYYKDNPTDVRWARAGEGSGFFIEQGGFILSLYHLMLLPGTEKLSQRIEITLQNGSVEAAKIIALEPTINLAILKINNAEDFPLLKIALPNSSKAGDPIFSIAGNTEKNNLNLSVGILQFAPEKECYQDKLDLTLMNTFIVLPKNAYGGPIFNGRGEVIGMSTINRHIASFPLVAMIEGREQALPIELAMNIYDSVKANKSTKSPWTGFAVRRTTEGERRKLQGLLQSTRGLFVSKVWPDSTASRLGIRPSDILISGNEEPMNNPGDLRDLLYGGNMDTPLVLEFLRDSQILKFNAWLELWTGIVAKDTKPRDREKLPKGIESKGIYVSHIWSGSPAKQANLSKGDILLKWGAQPVNNTDEWQKQIQKLGPRNNVQVDYYRNQRLVKQRIDVLPWLGFATRTLTKKETKGLYKQIESIHGIAIDFVWKNSPAKKLGIQTGDILIKMNDEPINSAADFQKWLYMYGIGETVTFEFIRGEIRFHVTDKIEERPKWAAPK